MKLFGHQEGTDNNRPIRLKEVAIATDPATLRLLARFLHSVADRMQSEGRAFGHEHFEDFDPAAPAEPSLVVTPD